MVTTTVLIDWGECLTGTLDSDGASVPYCSDVAPPARLSLLAGLAHLMRAAATTPYASQALVTDVSQANLPEGWQFGQVYGPATRSAQVLVIRSGDLSATGGAPADTQLFADMSGTASAEEVTIASSITSGVQDSWPLEISGTFITEGSKTYNATLSAKMDRQLEIVPALNSCVERIQGKALVGLTTRPEQVTDLETI